MSNQIVKTFDWTFDTEPEDQPFRIKNDKLIFLVIILAIIILFTVLFICTRWTYGHLLNLSSPQVPLQTFTFPSSLGLSTDAIKKLPIILHQADCSSRASEEAECCICLSEFKDGEKVKVLPSCDHCFHCECVDKWLLNHSSCPLCRASLKMDYAFPQILIQEPPVRYS